MNTLSRALFALLLLAATPALAQNSLSDLLGPSPEEQQRQILDNYSFNDYVNLYFQDCTRQNNVSEVQDYVDLQCACTAAEMTAFMDKEDLRKALTDDPDRDYQMARIMMNAYIPCLRNSIGDFVYDQCLTGQYTNRAIPNKGQFCECLGEGLGDYAVGAGVRLVPGFQRFSFKASDMGDSPFFAAVTTNSFNNIFDYYTPECLRRNIDNF